MSEMVYVPMAELGKKVSRIFYGTADEPFSTGGDGNDLLDSIYACGVNAFDSARVYGLAEKSLGNWIAARNNREDIVVLTKCAHPSPDGRKRVSDKDIREDIEKSLRYLQTDYIDIYLLHRDDPDVPAGDAVEIMNALKAEGKIRMFGGSNWTHERIEEANEYAYKKGLIPFSVSSPNFGLANQVDDPWGGGCITISGPANENARTWYEKNQMPVIAYSSLGRGLFSGRIQANNMEQAKNVLDDAAMKGYGYPENFERLRRCEQIAAKKGCSVAQIAMAWIYNQPINSFAIVSTRSAARMRENIKALHVTLTAKEVRFLDLKEENDA